MREMKLPPDPGGPARDIADGLRAHVEATRAPLSAAEPGPARAHEDEPLGPPDEDAVEEPEPEPEPVATDLTAVERRTKAMIRNAVQVHQAFRAVPQHRPGTGPYYRQEGELAALDRVLDYLETGNFERESRAEER